MRRHRLGFLGVGWIGRHRMRALAASGVAEVAFVADLEPVAAEAAAQEVGAAVVTPYELLNDVDVDGMVIATPSALHAEQAITALHRGVAVFCQKPLGRTAGEVADVIAAASRAGTPLGVDLSYRYLTATEQMRAIIGGGKIGDIYAADLVFHNAYGPDKPWFLDRDLSGGGCVIDLGIHLLDLASWLLPDEQLQVRDSQLFARGVRLSPGSPAVEDFATATLDTSSGGSIHLACSWFLHAGRDALISATFHGSGGGVALENVGGSFFDFTATLRQGTTSEVIASPPDDWGGRAAVDWARKLGGEREDRATVEREFERLVATAALIDRVYGR
jgi:predicted dehydrogenase